VSIIVRQGDSGAVVGRAQQALLEAGYAIQPVEVSAARFGPSTLATVRAWQAHHTGPDGHALAEDGIAGPATLWSLDHPGGGANAYTAAGWSPPPPDLRPELAAVLAAAAAELGQHEEPDGSNRGPRIDLYTAPQLGEPWCADFVSWCYRAAGAPFGHIRGVYTLTGWGRANGRVVKGAPAPGDLFLALRPPSHGHTGLVASLSADGATISTLEGNSANAVRALVRPVASISLFVRPLPPLDQ
jgi:hypothetical protein